MALEFQGRLVSGRSADALQRGPPIGIGTESGGQEIDENAHLRRHVAVLGADRVDRRIAANVAVQDGSKRAPAQIVADDEAGDEDHALPFQRRLPRRSPIEYTAYAAP